MIDKGKVLKCLLILVMVLTKSACQAPYLVRTEIKDIEFIRVVGVDKVPGNEGEVRLTIATQTVQAGEGTPKKESEILYSEGKTVFEAVRNFWNYMDRRPFWGHLEYVLIGEEASRDGLLKYIDFFSRDPRVRLNLKVFQIQGNSAEEVITKANSSKKFVFEKLNGVIENRWGQSVYNVVDLMEVMYILDKEHLSLYLPIIDLQQLTEYAQDEVASMDIVTGGFALFKGDTLDGYLDKKMGRGLNWLRNKVRSGVITVKSQEEQEVSLDIIDSHVKLEPKLVNGELSVTVKVNITTSHEGVRSNEDVFTEQSLDYLKSQQEQFVRDEIESVIIYAQENEIDFFGTGDIVYRKYPIQWEDTFSHNWREEFTKIPFHIIIKSEIIRTYDIVQPNRSEKSEDK